MSTIIPPVDGYAIYAKVQYSDTEFYRWTSAGSDQAIAGDGTYEKDEPVIDVSGMHSQTARIEERELVLTLADPLRTYQAAFSTPGWLGRTLDIYWRSTPTAALVQIDHGALQGRAFLVDDEQDAIAVLRYSSELARRNSVHQRLTNEDQQRQIAPLDDSMDRVIETINIIWGGRGPGTS